MDILVLDSSRQVVGVVDVFESFIWTERYYRCGDFELVVEPSIELMDLLQQERYLSIYDSEYVMIIEKLELTTDNESGNKLIVSGRSVESVLDRRIIEVYTRLVEDIETSILWLLDQHVINPTNTWRKIPEITKVASSDARVRIPEYEGEHTGDNLYETICKLCELGDFGFKMTLNASNLFLFQIYMGVDRSYAQTVNPYVVFSPEFDNLINSNYIESNQTLKTVARVGGVGDADNRKYKNVAVGGGAGLLRREIFVDGSDLTYELEPAVTETDPETGLVTHTPAVTLSDYEYEMSLATRGYEVLKDHPAHSSFEGKAENLRMYMYGRDYFMGDTIQFEDIYGIKVSAKVVEFVRSYSESGISQYPTFSVI